MMNVRRSNTEAMASKKSTGLPLGVLEDFFFKITKDF